MATRTLQRSCVSSTERVEQVPTGRERIAQAFETATRDSRAALMPYLMGGFPDPETATRAARACVDSGADLVELGVPFSDPLADGPVIHAAATRALASGVNLDSVLETAREISDRVPVVLLCYANQVLTNPSSFIGRAGDAGVAGLIVPDLPIEEAGAVLEECESRGLALIPLIAPTTTPERRKAIAERASGFVYLVSSVGTTGERSDLADDLIEMVGEVRQLSPVPVAVGFGISTPEQAAEIGEAADGVIIGSRLVRAVAEAGDPESAAGAVSEVVGESAAALRR